MSQSVAKSVFEISPEDNPRMFDISAPSLKDRVRGFFKDRTRAKRDLLVTEVRKKIEAAKAVEEVIEAHVRSAKRFAGVCTDIIALDERLIEYIDSVGLLDDKLGNTVYQRALASYDSGLYHLED